MFTLTKNFILREHNQNYFGLDFQPQHVPSSDDVIMLCHKQLASTRSNVVAAIIQGIVDAQLANIPLILNRTGQSLADSTIPNEFCIGLFTSGTTGTPKLVFHALSTIIPKNTKTDKAPTSSWLLCYEPMSLAGLQVILQAIVCEDTLIVSKCSDVKHKAKVAVAAKVNAISATPSTMRALLMHWDTAPPPLRIISLGGEIADQSLLDTLSASFPKASIRHIYAATETGVLFTVRDGLAGFPSVWLGKTFNGWTLQAKETLKLISKSNKVLDTGDTIEVTPDRVIFRGRQDNIINVGGVKVDLEKIEQSIIALPSVSDVRVYSKSSQITGAVVCAEISTDDEVSAKSAVKALLKNFDAPSRPRIISYTRSLSLSTSGKKQRRAL